MFLLTSSLFLIVAKLTSRDKTTLASPSVAIPGMIRAIKPVIPYMIVVAVVIMAYKYPLNTKLDEFTATVIMPVIMLMLVAFELVCLLPPVALNQLLTRLVVGEKGMDEADVEVSQEPFCRRYERWVLAVIVVGK